MSTKITKSRLREIIREELEVIQPQHLGIPSGFPSDDQILSFAQGILDDPDSLSPEEKVAIKKLLRNRAERLRRGIEGESEMYPGSGKDGFSKDPKVGAYAGLRKDMIDIARKIK